MPLDSRHRSRSDRGQASSSSTTSSNRSTTNRSSSNAINTSKDSKSSSNARSRSKPGSREDNKDKLKGKSYENTRASASLKKEIEVSSSSATRDSSITNRIKNPRKEQDKTVNELLMKDETISNRYETEKHQSGAQ